MVQRALQEADAVYFDGCDGYGPARKSGDGMTVVATQQFGLHPMLEVKEGDTVRRTPEFGVQGIAYCGAALSDLQEFPQFWMRKVSLLRARALHRFTVGDVAGAEADLDAAEASATIPSDPFYERSLKLALAFERAYFLSRTGHQGDAETLAMSTWAERPYSREVTYSAVIAIGPAGRHESLERLDKVLDTLDPGHSSPPTFVLPPAPADASLPSAPTAGQDAEALYSMLPEPEIALRIAPAPEGADQSQDCRGSGSCVAIPPDRPAISDQSTGIVVSFYGDHATLSITEEQSLLRAAIAVRQAGKRFFVIVRRQDIWHMRTRDRWACGYRRDGLLPAFKAALVGEDPACTWTDTYAAGFESDLNVAFADPNVAPIEGRSASGGVLDAEAIYAALAPIYLTAAPTPANQ